jgi:TPR repeat protein
MGEEVESIDVLSAQAENALVAGNIPQLINLYQRMEALGVWQVTARIGELYETGYRHGKHTFEKNLDEAVTWYRKAVFESDDPIAHLGLGRIYYEGSVAVKSDPMKARLHLQKAYDRGVHQAGIYLGIMSMSGVGVEKNIPEARKFFSSAARDGFPIAYRYLANIEASTGNLRGFIEALVKAFALTIRLKLQDRNHPNLWKMPK